MHESHAEPPFLTALLNCRFRHSFLFRHALVLSFCLPFLPICGVAPAQNAADNTFPLSISAAPGAPQDAVLSPPPGEYRMPRGSVAVVRAGRLSAPEDLPEWRGDAAGAARAQAVSMDGPRRFELSFPAAPLSSGVAESFAAPENGPLHAFMGSGGLYGWFTVNRYKEDTGAGIAQLVSADAPFCPVFNRPNLNFEHIMNGCRNDQWRAEDTPRTDPMRVRFLSPSSVEVCWPAQHSAWNLDCVMRYTFTGRNAVDMVFEVTPRADEAPRGFLVFMWASYMHMVRGRTIHFPGVRDGVEGWVAFGKQGESGTVPGGGQPPLELDSDAGVMNLALAEGVRFTEPVYYGLVDGDQNMDTADDAMAFIMMFDEPASTRFAVWNWGDIPYCSAWDWQFVVCNPEVGRTYRQRARMVFKRFAGDEDVLAEYRRWSADPGGAAREAPLPLEPFPAILLPGQERQDPVQLGDSLLAADPARALRLYREALRRDLRRPVAVERIRDICGKQGGPDWLAAFWAAITRDGPADSDTWYEFGLANEGAGNADRAAAAHREALRLRPDRQPARMRLGGLTAGTGDVAEGLRLFDEAVDAAPGLAGAAAGVCDEAAQARRRAGDTAGAVALLRRAQRLAPDNLRHSAALGGALEDAGDDAGALEAYRAVVTAVPESPHSSDRIDAIYERRNDAAERAAEWRRMVEARPGAVVPQLHLGLALEAAGDAAGAEAAYRAALSRNAKSEADSALFKGIKHTGKEGQ
jgi:tetratricopeptide (TPR) repeat protein